jgi:hypothetical protein
MLPSSVSTLLASAVGSERDYRVRAGTPRHRSRIAQRDVLEIPAALGEMHVTIDQSGGLAYPAREFHEP